MEPGVPKADEIGTDISATGAPDWGDSARQPYRNRDAIEFAPEEIHRQGKGWRFLYKRNR